MQIYLFYIDFDKCTFSILTFMEKKTPKQTHQKTVKDTVRYLGSNLKINQQAEKKCSQEGGFWKH